MSDLTASGNMMPSRVTDGNCVAPMSEGAEFSDGTLVGGITRGARIYAVRELLRRAGLSNDQCRSCKIAFDGGWTVVYVELGNKARIRFRNAQILSDNALPASRRRVVRAHWMHPPEDVIRHLVPHFVVPFAGEDSPSDCPLFQKNSADCVDCNLDLPLSTLLTLSRFEESQTEERDSHGRFAAAMSLAHKHGYLLHPIVDEYGLALEEALRVLLPQWQPTPRRLRVKLSHDVDFVGIPSSLREIIGHTLVRHRPFATLRDLTAKFTEWNPIYLQLVIEIAQLSISHGLDSAFYWKASRIGPNDSGYDPRHPKVRQVIRWLVERGIESGIHPGYETYRCRDRLLSEVRIIQEVLGRKPIGGRQHFLRWSPESWLDWESCGLAYDSSLGFADAIGFRAGTCFPYRPWIMSENREADILEIPLVAMDCTPIVYMGLTLDETWSVMETCIDACNAVGGVFTLLWHNTTLLNRAYGNLYQRLLERLAGAPGLV